VGVTVGSSGAVADPGEGLRQAYDALVSAADAHYRDLRTLTTTEAATAMAALDDRLQATTELIDLLESAVATCLERSVGGTGRG
jgi:hypothetical protein